MTFVDHGDYVTDTTTGYNGSKVPTERKLWGEGAASAPNTAWRLPTVTELQSLIANQKADLAGCTLAFGEGNLPTDWFWTYKIDPARQNLWDASSKSPAETEAVALEKPGHVATFFVWMGFSPINRRMEQALCRYIQWD